MEISSPKFTLLISGGEGRALELRIHVPGFKPFTMTHTATTCLDFVQDPRSLEAGTGPLLFSRTLPIL